MTNIYCVSCLFAIVLFGIYIFLRKIWKILYEIPPIPKLPDTWWGPENSNGKTQDDTSTKPFQINISEQVINDLHLRLKNTRPLSPCLTDIKKHQYGIDSSLTNEIIHYWLTKYHWREREQFLNQYPQFKTKIQGLNIHFLHVKPENTEGLQVIPLLILHGWPGSVREFYEIIPLLTTPQKGRNFVFEVIAPSLPGYGFSDAPVHSGLGAPQIAVIFKNLMLRLKHNRFYVQAGDWGSIIMTNMAILFPEHVMAIHCNMCVNLTPKSFLKRILYGFWPSLIVEKKYENRLYPIKKFLVGLFRETGYYHIQATKPDTIGVALGDSPAGLAAYILEKFIDENGQLTKKFTMEKLLDNVMIYWLTNSMTTAMRLYAEAHNQKVTSLKMDKIPVEVPTGYARFTNDVAYYPKALLDEKYRNLIHINDLEGGHFAALECPNILATDIYDFIEKVLIL